MVYSLKTNYCDDFKCIADKCSFSCCKGWEVFVDAKTYDKWNNDVEKSKFLCQNVIIKRGRRKTEAYIKMGAHKNCPFLNEKDLCNIVISCGEDYLAKTCKTFPRIENSFVSWNEYSLSCACPEVVDIIYRKDGDFNLLCESGRNTDAVPCEIIIRDHMISIMQNKKYFLKDRMLLTFDFLLSIKDEHKTVTEVIYKFQKEKTLSLLVDNWSQMVISGEDSLKEVNELFLDIAQNYRKEINYKKYLEKIYQAAENQNFYNDQNLALYQNFDKTFKEYEKLLENCIISKIFADCIKEDIDEIIVSFQMIITEYVMIRHSVYLKYLLNKHGDACKYQDIQNDEIQLKQLDTDNQYIPYLDVRDYITVYSRIIGYNTEGIREFWEESFDEAIWEFGYLILLLHNKIGERLKETIDDKQ